MSYSSGPPHKGGHFVNVVVATMFLLFSIWNLVADARLTTHLLLQSSFALFFLWLFISAWFLGGLILAYFPKRVFITAFVILTFRSSLGWPLSLATGLEAACHALNFLLVAIAALYLVWLFLRPTHFYGRPWFRWQHSAVSLVSWMGITALSFVTGLLGVAATVDEISSGFVQITPRGIFFTEKIFQKDEHRVHLIGLAHIGESDFYRDLQNAFKQPIDGDRLVLTEGVTDEGNILPAGFKSGNTYAGFAKQLGLEEQKSFAGQDDANSEIGGADLGSVTFGSVTFMNADIDISELKPMHLNLLITLLETMESGNLIESLIASSSIQISSEEMEDFLLEGLIGQRNEHLMTVYKTAHPDFEEIHIPWGAAHLPDLERRFLSEGFSLMSKKRRLGIRFH